MQLTIRGIFSGKKNDSKFVRVECKGEGCGFYCSAGWEERAKCFQVRAINLKHRCTSKFTLGIISQKWMEWKYEDKVRQNQNIGYTELTNDVKAELKLNVTINMCRRAIEAIKDRLDMGYESQFKKIRDYAQECLNSNPGSTIVIKTTRVVDDAPAIFQRMYVCFEALKRGFLVGCRRVIGLDGCFLKGKLKGEILSAVGRDANNQMYPIAWAVVEIENNSSWRWFLELLRQDLEMWNGSDWTLISDQQKGLSAVVQDLFPGVEHRNCARHVHANWSKTHRRKVMKKHFWQIAKSTNEAQLEENLKELEKLDVVARKDLDKYPIKFWCRAYFKESLKCDIVDNNLSEAFNNTMVNARSKQIIPVLEEIRVARISKKKTWVERWSGDYGSFILKKLEQNIVQSAEWVVDFNGDDGYEIKKGRHQFKVTSNRRTCSCRHWDLSGIPCCHAICAIFDNGGQPEEYLDDCYKKDTYLRIYAHALQPMNGEIFWPKTQGDEILAPVPKKWLGGQKKRRKLEENEPKNSQSTTHLSRKGRVMTCTKCNQKGHNKRFCPTMSSQHSSAASASSSAVRGGRTGRVRGRGRSSVGTD